MIRFFLLLAPVCLLAAEPVCHKCEVIRDYNKDHPGFDGYYEDYLEKQPAPKEAAPAPAAETKKSP